MTGRTHVIVGAAAGVAAASALGWPVAVTELAAAAAGGALGGTLPDLDVRNSAHPLRDRLARVAAVALLALAICLDATAGWPLARRAAQAGLESIALGAVAFAALCCAARLSAHRSFSHSLLALVGFAAATRLSCPPLAPALAAGLASHLVLDLFNHRPIRLLWPVRRGFCLGLCKTDGIVDACCTAAGLVVVAGAVLIVL